MKILMIANRHYPAHGGSEEVQKSLSKIFNELGHEVTIIATDLKYSHGHENIDLSSVQDDTKILRFKALRLGSDPLTFSPSMYSWIIKNANNFDLIYIFTYGYHTSIIPAFLKTIGMIKKPIAFQPHYAPNKNLPGIVTKIFDYTLGKFTVKKSDFLVLLTSKYKEFFIKQGAKGDSIFIAPPVVPTINNVGQEKQLEIMRKFNIPEGKKYIISVGRVVKYKGIQYTLNALKKLRESNLELFNEYHFIVAGDGEYLDNLRVEVKLSDLTEKVTFTGRVDDKDREVIYNIGDIFSFMSYSGESFGIVIVEAMSAGCPVISSKEGAVDTIVKNDYNGFLVDYDNSESIVHALEKLDKNLQFYKTNAISTAKQYDYQSVKTKIKQMLDTVEN